MWWAMKDARGEKTVRSMPRSSISRSWFGSMLWRSSSSLTRRSAREGVPAGSVSPLICWVRHASSAGGAVV